MTNDRVENSTFLRMTTFLRIPEQRINCTVLSFNCTIINELLNKFSNLNKTCRILAYCIRFVKYRNCKYSSREITPEISNSLNLVYRTVQKQIFSVEYNALSANSTINSSSILNSLSPFMGEDKLIRVAAD